MSPQHDIWQRCRLVHHGGAIRSYAKPPSPQYGRTSPVYCEHCARAQGCGEREGEGEGERKGERWEDWDGKIETENPMPKFDFLDEIDLSAKMEGKSS